ncbi:Fur family transcriptional regulator [Nocardioides sp. Iso805N]|uniref:Fur family transcriptional regulator n=1 Tax=Nocardioides sp. Iso805N TaxID=1283287 RepID=UPI000375B6CE|nr:transcriptional repressor [Nocardioides sp. Iso805N]
MARPQRVTKQGGAVRDALRTLDGFHSAQDVYATLRTGGDSVGLATVYRHLQSLVETGEADVIRTASGETTYRLCGESAAEGPDHHHHHLVCRRCGKAVDVEGKAVEAWAAQVAKDAGYVDVDHTVEIFGTCAECAAK